MDATKFKPHKPGYKKTSLGWIPEEWDIKTLGEVCSLKSGGTPSRKQPGCWNGNIPWITTSLVDFNTIYNADEFITEKGLKNSSAKIFPEGTTIMAIYGQGVTRGKVAKLGIDASTNQACVAFLNKDKDFQNFLFYILSAHYSKLRNISNDGSQKNLSSSLLSSYKLPLPPLAEQKKIAEILSCWDKAIETLEQLIDKKEELKKGLMQQLLTGKIRLRSASGERFSDEWKEVRLGKILQKDRIKGKSVALNEEKRGVPYIGSVGFDGQFDSYTDDENAVLVDKTDVLLLWDGEYAGKVATHLNGAASSTVVVLKVKKEKMISYFLAQKMVHDNTKIRAITEGSGIPHIPKDFTKWYKILVPSLGEQEKIVAVLRSLNDEIETLKQNLSALQIQKKGLMQQLLTGKTRVKL